MTVPKLRDFDVTATFSQKQEALSGNWLYVCRQTGCQTSSLFKGYINISREMSLQKTRFVALNWTPGSGEWALRSFVLILNAGGDTNSGFWNTAGFVTTSGAGTVLLVKK